MPKNANELIILLDVAFLMWNNWLRLKSDDNFSYFQVN